MSVNRLAELVSKDEDDFKPPELNVVENQKKLEIESQVAQYAQLNGLLDEMKNKTNEIIKIKNKDQKEASPVKRAQNSELVDGCVQACMAIATNVKNQLNTLKEDNMKYIADEKNQAKNSTRAQVRLNYHTTHLKKFMTLMNNFNSARQEFKKQSEDRQVRQLVNVGVDEEKAQNLVESGGDYQDVVAEALASDGLVDQINDLRDRKAEIMKLERSVEEVFRMFQDLATLVDLQGESLNVIEERIVKAKDYTEKAQKELVEAGEYQDKNRKLLCAVIILALIILCAVLFPILKAQGNI
jgi:t-SNARE complex subunit (syntaxin)